MIECRKVRPGDIASLVQYFNQLSDETKGYFTPHPFDLDTITSICLGNYKGYQAFIYVKNDSITAYTVLKNGLNKGELNRFVRYPISIHEDKDFILAPSVADVAQSQGIGTELLSFVEAALRKQLAEKIILWGGVQRRNQRAVHFYLKNGFSTLGTFWHDQLENLDMVKYLSALD